MFVSRDIEAVYAGAGEAYDLPPDVLAARSAMLALTERRTAAHLAREAADEASRHARSRTAAELLSLAVAGEPLPADPGGAIQAAKAEAERTSLALTAWSDAVATAERALRTTLRTSCDAIFEALQPALAEVVEAVRQAAPALAGIDLDRPDAVIASPAKVKAYGALLEASARHDRIRAAQQGAWRTAGNLGRLPGRAEIRHPGTARLHGLEGPRRLLALVAGGAELWCPTENELRAALRRSEPGAPTTVTLPGRDGDRTLRGRRPVGEYVEA